jgi:hypothetical protein
MPKTGGRDYVKAGRLEIILANHRAVSTGFFLSYPRVSQALPKLRAFIDHIKSARRIEEASRG